MSDTDDERAIRELIAETYEAMSSRKPGTARFFAHPDIGIAGSGQGELVSGPEMAARMAAAGRVTVSLRRSIGMPRNFAPKGPRRKTGSDGPQATGHGSAA